SNVADGAASGGYRVVLSSDQVGDFIEFTSASIPAGTYELQFTYHKASTRGVAKVSADNVVVGNTIDQYASPSSYQTTTVARVAFGTTGTHAIRLTVDS